MSGPDDLRTDVLWPDNLPVNCGNRVRLKGTPQYKTSRFGTVIGVGAETGRILVRWDGQTHAHPSQQYAACELEVL